MDGPSVVSDSETLNHGNVSDIETQRGAMTARVPRPGGPVRGSTTGRPLMAALDLLGRRWALRILWELRDEPLGARALRSRCDGMSSSVLYERLQELTDAGLLDRDDVGAYRLTELGAALAPALESLDSWARRWSDALQETDRSS
jgi:DNA-binding HxlR family transcriptional regulator